MPIKEVARIEMWETQDGQAINSEYDDLYFIAKTDEYIYWFNMCLDIIDSPIKDRGYNLRPFAKIINSGTNGTFEASPTEEYDIIFYEDGVIPYNRHEDIDYKELLWKLLVQRGYETEEGVA